MSNETAMLLVAIVTIALAAANVVLVFLSQRRVDVTLVRELSQQLRELAERTQTRADDALLDVLDRLIEVIESRNSPSEG